MVWEGVVLCCGVVVWCCGIVVVVFCGVGVLVVGMLMLR